MPRLRALRHLSASRASVEENREILYQGPPSALLFLVHPDDEKERTMTPRMRKRAKQLGRSLALAATVGGFWLAAGAPLYRM